MRRKAKAEKNSYPCRQHELYDTAETAWNLFVLHLGDFTKFKGSYSTKFYEGRMQDVEKAKNIKSRKVMQQEFTELRKEMAFAKKDVLYYYRCTLQYIKGSGPVSSDKGIYFEVSKSDYKKAANNNWRSCNGIKMSLENILTKRKDDLIKDYDVPESFIAESLKVCKTFSKLYFTYDMFKSGMKHSSQEKVKLNNIIYSDLTLLLSNAQFIYRNRKDMQQLFQFDKLLKIARKKKKNSTTAEAKPAVLSFLNKVAAMF